MNNQMAASPGYDNFLFQDGGRRFVLYFPIKRCLDIIFSLTLGALFLPIIVLLSLVIGLNGGNIIFFQSRIGRNGKTFKIYKFRTMVLNAEKVLDRILEENPSLRDEWVRDAKLKNDPRITFVGKFLRRTSLDELPQLWNVLIGDMSMVGPRPVVSQEILKYGRYARFYYARRPGLTGIWQVSGRNDISYSRRVAMDTVYTRSANLWLDLLIIAKTARIVLLGKGAY